VTGQTGAARTVVLEGQRHARGGHTIWCSAAVAGGGTAADGLVITGAGTNRAVHVNGIGTMISQFSIIGMHTVGAAAAVFSTVADLAAAMNRDEGGFGVGCSQGADVVNGCCAGSMLVINIADGRYRRITMAGLAGCRRRRSTPGGGLTKVTFYVGAGLGTTLGVGNRVTTELIRLLQCRDGGGINIGFSIIVC